MAGYLGAHSPAPGVGSPAPFLQLTRPCQVSQRAQSLRQVDHRGKSIRVLGPKHPTLDRQRLQLQLVRTLNIPLRMQRAGQVFIEVSVSRCSGPSTRLADLKRLFIELVRPL